MSHRVILLHCKRHLVFDLAREQPIGNDKNVPPPRLSVPRKSTGEASARERIAFLIRKVHNTAVELTFTRRAGKSLTESQLSEDQTVTINDDDTLSVKATVNMTSQLVWWLRGFGDGLLAAKPDLLYQAVLGNSHNPL